MEQTLNNLLNEMKTLKEQNQYLNSEIEKLKPTNNSSNPTTTVKSNNSVKINKPLEYSGDRTLTKAFIAQNELVFRSQPDSFLQDSQKITYLASYLRGNAFHWYYTQEVKGKIPTSYSEFSSLFLQYFGQQDEQNEAEQKIQKIYQKTTVSQYNQLFNKYAVLVDYNDSALMNIY